MRSKRRLLVWKASRPLPLLVVAISACAPIQSTALMANPAKTTDRITSTQSIDIPPDVASHRYEVALVGWTPTTLRFQTRVVEIAPCGRPGSLVFSLLDDHGREHPWRVANAPADRAVNLGRRDELHESAAEGEFDASIGADSRYVVFRIRPTMGHHCRSFDFRWDFRS